MVPCQSKWEISGKEHVYGGIQVTRFNLPWLLGGEATGDGEAPDWVTAGATRSR